MGTRKLAGGDARNATFSQRLFAGGFAGAASQTCIHPIDVMKTQMTVAETGEYSSLIDCVRRTAVDENLGTNTVSRFYRGYGAALCGIVPFMATKLGSYTYLCAEYQRRHNGERIGGIADQLVATSCSLVGIVVAYPFNLGRVKLQVQGVNGRSMLYSGVVDCLEKTVRHEGWVGLYRGFVPNLIKALPAQSILLQVQRRASEALLESH